MHSKTIFIVILIFFSVCTTTPILQRMGSFHKIENKIMDTNEINVEQSLRVSRDCYFTNKHLGFDDDLINNNLEKMTSGDTLIIGFRDLKIKYEFYPIIFGVSTGIFTIDCITFSGYAIHKKEEKDNGKR